MAKITKTKTKVKPKFKSYISEFTLILDAMLVRGRVVSIGKPVRAVKPTFKFVSPEENNPVVQVYKDEITGKFYQLDELKKQWDTSAPETVVVDQEALKKIRESQLPKNVLTVAVHDTDDVTHYTYPEATEGFVFDPDMSVPQNKVYYDMIVAGLIANPSKTLIGMCNFHGYEGLFRVEVWRGYLTLHKIKVPSAVNDHEVLKNSIDEQGTAAMAKVLDRLTKPFDPEEYRDHVAERMSQAVKDPEAFNKAQEQTEDEEDEEVTVTNVLSVLDSLGMTE